MNKKKSPGNIPLPGDFFLFKRIIRLYLTGSPYGAKRNCYSGIFTHNLVFCQFFRCSLKQDLAFEQQISAVSDT